MDDTCCSPGRGDAAEPLSGGVPIELTPTTRVPASPTGARLTDLVTIPAGEFLMGSDSPDAFPADGEGPVRLVSLGEYRIAPTCVTNTEFAEFVAATGHVTEAESFGWSYVFGGLLGADAAPHVIDGSVPGAPWWRGVRGATWQHPTGPGSSVDHVEDHPVVHVSWNDALAYCRWRGVRLPTEAEWERAARGGLEHTAYPWGDELTQGGEHRANIWQGRFPTHNTEEDGWFGTAPATAFSPNGFGLYNTSGNVWEWTADWFSPVWHREARTETRSDPHGPSLGVGRVVRGGSYLCHDSYCNRYRAAARTMTTPDSSLGHTGFRVAADAG